jgi:hypothetical protein
VAREPIQAIGDVQPNGLMPAPPKRLHQRAATSQGGGIRRSAPVAEYDMDRHQVAARGPGG